MFKKLIVLCAVIYCGYGHAASEYDSLVVSDDTDCVDHSREDFTLLSAAGVRRVQSLPEPLEPVETDEKTWRLWQSAQRPHSCSFDTETLVAEYVTLTPREQTGYYVGKLGDTYVLFAKDAVKMLHVKDDYLTYDKHYNPVVLLGREKQPHNQRIDENTHPLLTMKPIQIPSDESFEVRDNGVYIHGECQYELPRIRINNRHSFFSCDTLWVPIDFDAFQIRF